MDRGQSQSLVISVLIHGAALGLLAVSINPAPEPQTPPAAAPVQARAVDEAQVMAEIERLHAEERAAEAAEQRRIDETRRREQERRAAEQRRQEAERQAAEERRRLAAQEEQRRIAEEQRRQQEAQRQEQERQAAEQRRREEAERQRQEEERRRAEEQRRREEAERQRREEEQRAQAEEALRQQMAAEQARLDAEQARQLNGERTAYAALIADKVGRNWVRPANLEVTGPCQVLVEQLPSGEVLKVEVLKTCGSQVLDRTVEAAVYKASPLPRPENPAVFDREILFTFKPR